MYPPESVDNLWITFYKNIRFIKFADINSIEAILAIQSHFDNIIRTMWRSAKFEEISYHQNIFVKIYLNEKK